MNNSLQRAKLSNEVKIQAGPRHSFALKSKWKAAAQEVVRLKQWEGQ